MTMPVLGYALDEPTAAACGAIVDDVPDGRRTGDIVREYEHWKQAAETQLRTRVQTGAIKVWVPVALPEQQVVSLFGGDPCTDWDGAVSLLLKVISDAGRAIRVVDFTSMVAAQLRQRLSKFPGRFAAAELAPGGSLDPLQGVTNLNDAAGFLADVIRADDDRHGRNSAAGTQNLIAMVTRALDPGVPLTLARVHAAVGCALTAQPLSQGVLSPTEEAAIINGPYAQLKQTPALVQELFNLDSLLALIAKFASGSQPHRKQGNAARGTVSLLSLAHGLSTTERELGHDILAARIAVELRRGSLCAATVILGADDIPPRLLDAMAAAARSSGSQLFVFFKRLTDGTKSRIGWHAGSVTGFFRLANHEDAAVAADFLGKQHRMVLSGISDTVNRSFEWGWSTTVSRGVSTSTSKAWSIGRGFSSTMSSATTRSSGTSQGTSGGGSVSTGSTTSYERVYEYLIEPSVFQGLGPGALLLVDVAQRAARLTSCAREVTRSDLVDWNSYVEIAEL